ncbi:MAG: hypothetical protein IJW53_00120 [Clostridia bacterium]|nr:hypothetical protein [Clostridia bacterium]
MKRIISTILVCVLLLGCVMTLASCGKTLSGKYTDALAVTSYEFKGSKYTLTVDNIIGADTVTEGKYKIAENDEGDLKITFTWEEDGEEKTQTESFSSGEEDGVEYIKIGIVKYTKAD